MSLEIISRIALQSEPDRQEQLLVAKTQQFIAAQPYRMEIEKLAISKDEQNQYRVKVGLSLNISEELDDDLQFRLLE